MKDEGNTTHWRSLRELTDREGIDELKAREFIDGATDDVDLASMPPMSRKHFLALLSASAALVANGCTGYRDRGEIVPYTRKPEEVTPGVANYYASTCTGCSQHCGILIKTREGRPIKVDGNPEHPVSRGKICATGQASILNLYDPQRLRKPAYGFAAGRNGELSWEQADTEIRKALDAAVRDGQEIALIAPPLPSPSAQKVLELFAGRYPSVRIYTYEMSNEENRRAAWKLCYGTEDLPTILWDRASVIVALESDFLGSEGSSIENTRLFTSGRDIVGGQKPNRLYSLEGTMSLTGANADYRLRLRPDDQFEFVFGLINEIGLVRQAVRLHPEMASLVRAYPLKSFADRKGIGQKTLDYLIDDLISHKGSAIVYPGATLPTEVHSAANYLNEVLGNTSLFNVRGGYRGALPLTSPGEFESLVGRMNAGKVPVVIHLQTNPVFHLPRSMEYQVGLQKVRTSVSLVQFDDETSQHCDYVLPVHHPFESWGDFNPRGGVTSFQQPVIAPLYSTRQAEAVLLYWAGPEMVFHESSYHQFLMGFWEKDMYPGMHRAANFTAFWNTCLHDGVVLRDEGARAPAAIDVSAVAHLKPDHPADPFVVTLRNSYFIGDGQFASNGWLQELPHPVSKIVWDNYAAISPKTAVGLGVSSNDVVRIALGEKSLELPVFVQPGMADGLVSVELGYGRWNAGTIGTGIGTDANALLPRDGLTGSRVFSGATVSATGKRYELVSTQEHHAIDDTLLHDIHLKRKIIREGTVDAYQRDPGFLRAGEEPPPSITSQIQYNGVKWAMAIDLNKCTGCNACVSGCNVENNIPVVGKDQVRRGRDMHWIRIDRYYAGSPDDPSLSHQPMLCQHCDNAPCENVCPVVATNHSPDGLNQMVYNRCVGTKYCSNNCPYKVRRFNFLNFRDNFADGYYLEEPVSLVQNPEVTVRSRGVMEKCTFCIQRIAEARQHAAEQGRPLAGSDVKTACQEACPAEAIVFGDMNDPQSAVSHYRNHPLGYSVLEEVNARPNVTYMARLKNTHPEKSA